MTSSDQSQLLVSPWLAWLSAAVTGVVAPAAALLLLPNASEVAGPVLAVGLMGTAMISAAVSGRLRVGVLVALLSGAALVFPAQALGVPTTAHPAMVGLAALIASISFAARGALFATSSGDRGWWIALFVVAGEAAILATAAADPTAIPGWLLVLLPAQWASIAIQSALGGSLSGVAIAAMVALGGTAAATLLVRQLWPRRWTYLVMFSTWLALSALVYRQL